jgi:heptosyltransferase-1
MRAFVRRLRGRTYDAVIDTQGLVRTALIARLARGCRHGYDAGSIREPLAARCYDVRHAVARDQHAIARNRVLTGRALGYAPQGEIDYGLDRAALAPPAGQSYAVLLHATAQPGKEWGEGEWVAVGQALLARGIAPVLPWGNEAERVRAERLAAQIPGARVPTRRPLDAVARLIAGARVVVGVDTGLLHLAAALGVPLIAIFGGSEPGLTGPRGAGPIVTLGGKGAPPATADVLAALARIG